MSRGGLLLLFLSPSLDLCEHIKGINTRVKNLTLGKRLTLGKGLTYGKRHSRRECLGPETLRTSVPLLRVPQITAGGISTRARQKTACRFEWTNFGKFKIILSELR